jgi:hypothetical protein
MIKNITTLFLALSTIVQAQYWQQEIEYTMDVHFNDENHQYRGTSEIKYTNNSPDTLESVYFHLYPNAFQPGSMMDVRSRNISDPDDRVMDGISKLYADQQGFLHISGISYLGESFEVIENQTLAEFPLVHPINPGETVEFSLQFEGQVPVQIRRSGRNNAEGVDYSMTQWYPRMVEYDRDGWNLFQYVGREFHGVFGHFDVTLHMDSAFTIAATGTLQNPEEIGHGYAGLNQGPIAGAEAVLSWHFVADSVHDFAWAADRDYTHDVVTNDNGPDIQLFYLADSVNTKDWTFLGRVGTQTAELMAQYFGTYPYTHYSIVQGGDGGMEYPMLTLISGDISRNGLISVTVHEFLHSWYQGVVATNEQLYCWMDEGFTEFAQMVVLAEMNGEPLSGRMNRLVEYANRLITNPLHEPMSILADHYETNFAYGMNAYYKGATFLYTLKNLLGDDVFYDGMKTYYNQWKFKHPTPHDFKRIMEKKSGMELEWFFNYFLYAEQSELDYALGEFSYSRESGERFTTINVERKGYFPMPISLRTIDKNGKENWYHIPLNVQGVIQKLDLDYHVTILEPWDWVNPHYEVKISTPEKLMIIELDPSKDLPDSDWENQLWKNK